MGSSDFRIAAFVFTIAVAPFAQSGAGIHTHAEDSSNRTANVVAPVAQYLVVDADIFIASAKRAAESMSSEAQMDMEGPSIIRTQGQFLVNAIDRAVYGA